MISQGSPYFEEQSLPKRISLYTMDHFVYYSLQQLENFIVCSAFLVHYLHTLAYPLGHEQQRGVLPVIPELVKQLRIF